VLAALAPFAELTIAGPEPVPDEPWPETWRRGLEALVISDRLLVRPSFVSAPAGFVGTELVIEPGQAFGTGGHASTRVVLDLLVRLPPEAIAGRRVLDVGCGSGVLALAALALGAERAVAFDLDPLASEATREAARVNGSADRLLAFTGPLDALAGAPFDLVLANLLRRELEPLLDGLVARLRAGGRLLLGGLLAREGDAIEARLAAAGLVAEARREIPDADAERWLGLVLRGPRNHSKDGA